MTNRSCSLPATSEVILSQKQLYIVWHDAVIIQYTPIVNHMPPGKPKIKTAVMTMRVSPKIKAAAELAAEKDHRSVANLVEVLILDRCKTLGIDVGAISKKETSNECKSARNLKTSRR